MTKEEAKDILEKYVKDCEGDDFDLLMTLNDEENFDAIKVSINSLSVLPSNLDEAEFEYAQSLDGIPANQEEEKMIYDAFKAGAEWRDAQIPKLPNSIDEAAEKMYPKQYAYMPKPGSTIDLGKVLRDAFKAGAEWQKEQDDKLVDIIYQQGIEKGKDEMRETLKKNEK